MYVGGRQSLLERCLVAGIPTTRQWHCRKYFVTTASAHQNSDVRALGGQGPLIIEAVFYTLPRS